MVTLTFDYVGPTYSASKRPDSEGLEGETTSFESDAWTDSYVESSRHEQKRIDDLVDYWSNYCLEAAMRRRA